MWIEKMSEGSIAADQNDLLKRATDAAFFQKPEEAFDRDVDNVVGGFFAGRTMNDVSNALHGGTYSVAVRDASSDNLQPLVQLWEAVVAQGANRHVRMITGA
jgi:hypothetical protein